MEENFQFRNVFNPKEVNALSFRIKKVYKEFDTKGFQNFINPKLKNLNYGERSNLIIKGLEKYLPKDFTKSANILIKSLGPKLTRPELSGFNGFIIVPESKYIAKHGINNYDLSMKALYEMTKRFSSEEAIRTFIEKFPKKTLKILKKWAKDKNVHVRRLVSEGSRPRLPLGSRLRSFQKNPKPVIELLELLKDDKELYVRRSVANNLNDIAKDNPKILTNLLKEWSKVKTKERKWLISHALRTLLKQGNKDALELLGFTKPEIKFKSLEIKIKKFTIGENLQFSLSFKSLIDQNLMVDYAIHYMKANGKLAKKVFKLSKKKTKKGELVKFNRKHSTRQMTTRKHYPGRHLLGVIINGKSYSKEEFALES